jgi:cell division protein FtsB
MAEQQMALSWMSILGLVLCSLAAIAILVIGVIAVYFVSRKGSAHEQEIAKLREENARLREENDRLKAGQSAGGSTGIKEL